MLFDLLDIFDLVCFFETSLCFNCQSINDVNNNFTNSTCLNCQSKARSEEKVGFFYFIFVLKFLLNRKVKE
jgi:hypothetical protein